MLLSIVAITLGLALLVWSADRFIDGASATARHFGMSPLLVGMLVVGFGTSLPEMVVSAFAAWQNNPSLAIGNAYGSNIANTALVLGTAALIAPMMVNSSVLRKELPLLVVISLVSAGFIIDGYLSRLEGILLLIGFFSLVGWSIWTAIRNPEDPMAQEASEEFKEPAMPINQALLWTGLGLILLALSSRVLVWGAVNIAQALGVSDLIIGLTIVALGTSLPELAAAVVAARKGEHDMALGNILGSNMFNLLAVVGIAATIHPLAVMSEVLNRDWVIMMVLTAALFFMAYGFRGRPGRINRREGGLLLAAYLAYSAWLIYSALLSTSA